MSKTKDKVERVKSAEAAVIATAVAWRQIRLLFGVDHTASSRLVNTIDALIEARKAAETG